jgi:threonine synthase
MLDLRFEPSFEPSMVVGRPHDLWRYREALPVGDDVVTMGEGWTPLLSVAFDGRVLLIKQEQLFPTGSYKDRGEAVLMTHLRELGVERVVEDSSGNAGSVVAAYAAHAGIACDIYAPTDTSPAKTAQIEAYGATLHRIPGTREEAARAALEAAAICVYASHVYNPWFLQGTKTFAYEVAEQLDWVAPDTLVLPAGNGTLVLGAYLGFTELARRYASTAAPGETIVTAFTGHRLKAAAKIAELVESL